MELKWIKRLRYLLVIILVISLLQLSNLAYQLFKRAAAPPNIELDLAELEESLTNIEAVPTTKRLLRSDLARLDLKSVGLFRGTKEKEATDRESSPPQASREVAESAPELILQATLTRGREDLALVELKERGQNYLLARGDKVADYRVEAIRQDSLLLSGAAGEVEVKLSR